MSPPLQKPNAYLGALIRIVQLTSAEELSVSQLSERLSLPERTVLRYLQQISGAGYSVTFDPVVIAFEVPSQVHESASGSD